MGTVLAFPAPARRAPYRPPPGIRARGTWTICPWSEEVSDYDKRHISTYAWLLHDESEGATEEELARTIFGLDPGHAYARGVVRSHLRRAHWVADTLFPLLDW
ncbi:MAG: hypothetical protein WDM86_18860 [Rhizomicrobium sp.]